MYWLKSLINISLPMNRFLPYLLVVFLFGCDNTDEQRDEPASKQETEIRMPVILGDARYVGKESCVACHTQETDQFTGSHHDLAMQHANSETVLGNFANAEFYANDVKSTFFKKDDKYFVTTDGVEGELEDFEIKYTFGVTPLQQYLIEFPGGRLQALSIAWDSRPEDEGGQRWFHLYPQEKITYDDELHWTGLNHNWNYMCAECHATNFEKNYNLTNDSYDSTWSEIDVSCEACHGPASNHIKLTHELTAAELSSDANKGFEVDFSDWSADGWEFKGDDSIASLKRERSSTALINSCGQCHSRRASMNTKENYKNSIDDAYIVSLLEPGLYHADGQVDDEVYVYGSFLQSKMYQAGVTCLDCHEPHSLKLRAEGNALCMQCHQENTYNSESHHFHKLETEASQCVSCHMPAKNFMVIDSRRDHSFRLPRPDLTIKTGSPNSCNQCHSDQSPEWAVDHIKDWYAKDTFDFHYGDALHAANVGAANAESLLLQLLNDKNQPAIARATALRLLENYLNANTFQIIYTATGSEESLLRRSSINALSTMAIEDRHKLLKHLLEDQDKSVRIHAANILASAINIKLSDSDRNKLLEVIDEFVTVQKLNGERAFSHVNLGNLYANLGENKKAQAAYKTAIEKENRYIPAYVNLADLYRQMGREEELQALLQEAIKADEDVAVFHYSMGLSLARQGKIEQSTEALQQASILDAENAQFSLAYAIALNSSGKTEDALAELKKYHQRHPMNGQILMTLSTINRDNGNIKESLFYAEKMLELVPDNPQVHEYIQTLQRELESDSYQ
jgi:predicted CXXCH cytochrome family protein